MVGYRCSSAALSQQSVRPPSSPEVNIFLCASSHSTLVASAFRNVHIGLKGRQKHVLSTCSTGKARTCLTLWQVVIWLLEGLREGLKVDVRGLVVMVRCWKMDYVHKSPHKAGRMSVCFCTCYIERTVICIFSGNIKATAFWKVWPVLQRAFWGFILDLNVNVRRRWGLCYDKVCVRDREGCVACSGLVTCPGCVPLVLILVQTVLNKTLTKHVFTGRCWLTALIKLTDVSTAEFHFDICCTLYNKIVRFSCFLTSLCLASLSHF